MHVIIQEQLFAMPKPSYTATQKPRDFETILLRKAGIPQTNAEVFATVPYEKECQWKNEAITEFWSLHKLEGNCQDILPSPRPRGYRTTSKRRVWYDRYNNAFSLRFSDGSGVLQHQVAASALDVPQHHEIYRTIIHKLISPPYRELAEAMNYVIIRGSYTEFAVILNVADMNSMVVRKLKLLSEHIKQAHATVTSCFAYHDPTRSAYYLDQQPLEVKTLRLKKLFGYDSLRLKLGAKTFLVSPTSFSQVNESMIPEFLSAVSAMLAPAGGERLFDLYCGYGLFAHSFANDYREIIAVELEGASIRAAKTMAEKTEHSARMKFLTSSISGNSLERLLPAAAEGDVFLLDPPRNGTEQEVIPTIAQRKPSKVVHIFCGIEELPSAIRQWKSQGYLLREAQPVDMFAGTTGIEIVTLLQRK